MGTGRDVPDLDSRLGAEEPQLTDKGAIVEGAGFTLFDMESIKGSDTDRVERDPVCDRSKRPKIHKVEPDEAKPGREVTIKARTLERRNVSTASPSARRGRQRSTTSS
jgi:hypothetical protein